jgi:hypothetical protein
MHHTLLSLYFELNGTIHLLDNKLPILYHGFEREENIGQLCEESPILMEIRILSVLVQTFRLISKTDISFGKFIVLYQFILL